MQQHVGYLRSKLDRLLVYIWLDLTTKLLPGHNTNLYLDVCFLTGMIPLWLFTLGQYILNEQSTDITIPFTNILGSLVGIIIPVGIGILIQKKKWVQ